MNTTSMHLKAKKEQLCNAKNIGTRIFLILTSLMESTMKWQAHIVAVNEKNNSFKRFVQSTKMIISRSDLSPWNIGGKAVKDQPKWGRKTHPIQEMQIRV